MAEAYNGEVRDGVVHFESDPSPWPAGTKVRIESVPDSPPDRAGPVDVPPDAEKPSHDPAARTRRMLLAWARQVGEVAPPLPADLAENHDRYAHGKHRP